MPSKSFRSSPTFLLVSLCLSRCALARFSYPVYCSEANSASSLFARNNQTQAYLPLLDDYTTCNQAYNASIPPAASAYVPYHYCKSHCSGFQLSQGDLPGAWAAPVVQFILPSIIFSMSIPRRTMFVPTWRIDMGFKSIFFGPLLSILTALDTLIWVALIITLAGPMMVSGLTEALLDYRILRALSPGRHPDLNDASRLRLVVTVVYGNLLLHDTDPAQTRVCPLLGARDTSSRPLREIPSALERLDSPSNRRARLLDLMSAQGNFGALVGAPVVFYLGGFIYTILDLRSDPSVQDAAISLAFGVEWMIVVHVAIIRGCLLASNNPSAVSVFAGQPPTVSKGYTLPLVYETCFQPVSMWQRGANKWKWVEAVTGGCSNIEQDSGIELARTQQNDALKRAHNEVKIRSLAYCGWVILPTIILISLPPAAGAVVAWKTPPVGWGCRSLTLVCYAGCELLVIVLHELRHRTGNARPWAEVSHKSLGAWFMSQIDRTLCVFETVYRGSLFPLYLLMYFFSLFTALGGTIMQIMGVYKDCFCYVNSGMWLRLSEAFVEVASDTLEQRDSSSNWITMGCVATGFMGACSYVGWFYQKTIRTEYEQRVQLLCPGK